VNSRSKGNKNNCQSIIFDGLLKFQSLYPIMIKPLQTIRRLPLGNLSINMFSPYANELAREAIETLPGKVAAFYMNRGEQFAILNQQKRVLLR
jgi:hypothetical protein